MLCITVEIQEVIGSKKAHVPPQTEVIISNFMNN